MLFGFPKWMIVNLYNHVALVLREKKYFAIEIKKFHKFQDAMTYMLNWNYMLW